jgi:hypothetical protein
MLQEVPTQVFDTPSWMGLLMLAVAGLGVLFFLVTVIGPLTGRSRRSRPAHATPASANHRHVVLVPLLVGLLLVGVMLLWGMSVKRQELPASAVVSMMPPAESVTLVPNATVPGAPLQKPVTDSKPGGAAVSASSVIAEENVTEPLPDWTQKRETVLTAGEVPSMLFVESSGLYSSEEEAFTEALTKAISSFQSRLAETYQQLAVQPVPEDVFRTAAIQQVYTEKRIHTFGAYEEPMYRVYLQFLDSAAVREPIVDSWKSTFSQNRALQYGIVFGILTAILGIVSAGLRVISVSEGSRGRAIMTALAVAAAVLAMGLALIS